MAFAAYTVCTDYATLRVALPERGVGTLASPLRASQRKGEWKVGNTIDLIRVILEEWGGGTARSERKTKRVGDATEKEFTLYLNEKNILWDSIRDYHGKMDDFIIRLDF